LLEVWKVLTRGDTRPSIQFKRKRNAEALLSKLQRHLRLAEGDDSLTYEVLAEYY